MFGRLRGSAGAGVLAVVRPVSAPGSASADLVDSAYAWLRLALLLALGAIGSAAMWVASVAVPQMQAAFGVSRAAATLPYTATTLGFAVGGILMGRLGDRFGVLAPVLAGTASLALGLALGGFTQSLAQLAVVQFVLIGMLGSSAFFGPLVADSSMWFRRRRGIAVAICACGNYVAGAIWPPITQRMFDAIGWRETYLWMAGVTLVAIAPLAIAIGRRRPPAQSASVAVSAAHHVAGLGSNALQVLLALAALSCCVAMAMPQVHIVSYCGDLGYGPARGAEMLSLMMAFGIVSRIGSGFMADRFGGMVSLMIGSIAQAVALFFYLFFTSLPSLYLISAMFGLFQGGIVPSYAIIVRETMPASEAATRVGIVIFASVVGMSFGGWISGVIFDLTGSYAAAFANGVGWNLLNVAIVLMLLLRGRQRLAAA